METDTKGLATPFPEYREWLLRIVGDPNSVRRQIVWYIHESSGTWQSFCLILPSFKPTSPLHVLSLFPVRSSCHALLLTTDWLCQQAENRGLRRLCFPLQFESGSHFRWRLLLPNPASWRRQLLQRTGNSSHDAVEPEPLEQRQFESLQGWEVSTPPVALVGSHRRGRRGPVLVLLHMLQHWR
jgi:hypothetical protein